MGLQLSIIRRVARERETMGRKSLPLGEGLAVVGGQLRVVGGVINPMRVWELLILVVNKVGVFVLPGFTAKCRDVEKTPEMRDLD